MGLLDLFVERDPKKPSKKADLTKLDVPISSPVAYVQPTGASVTEFTEHFKQILKEENTANFPGNDFYEFFVVKSNMHGIPEQQAYMIAFSGLSAAGLTKEKLLETANKYLAIVDREIKEFDASFNQMFGTEVTIIEQQIASKTQEIGDLTQRITDLNTEVGELRSKVMTNTQRLSDKKNGFMMAGNAQKQEIQNEINKINQYII